MKNKRFTIIKTIVDTKRNLRGFIIRGKDKEFGGFGDNVVEVSRQIGDLLQNNFVNEQIMVNNKQLVERGNFKINELPMCVYVGEKGYIDVGNKIDIIGRFEQNNENVGFRVRFEDGSEDNVQYKSLLAMSKWFKPNNFIIRTSKNGRSYISGKPGVMSLETLPVTMIGDSEHTTKRMKSGAKSMKESINGSVSKDIDILDIYQFIDNCDGSVIKLPDEKYVANTEAGEVQLDRFTSLGIGEVASAKPMFNPTKINVNSGFKQVGLVNVTINGGTLPLTTYVHRSKNIFYNGENYMKKIGIAVSADREADLLNTLGRSFALEKITDNKVIQPLSQVIDAKSLAFYSVDTSKVDLISEKKRAESLLTEERIAEICKQMYSYKLISKALGPKGGIMKNLKEEVSEQLRAEARGRKLFGVYAAMNEDALRAISEAGIDIYTGAYTEQGTPVYKKSSEGSDTETVEVEYILENYDHTKLTGAKVITAVKNGDTTLPEKVTEIVRGVLSINDSYTMYKTAVKLYEEAEKEVAKLNKVLWLHMASMYLAGNKTSIHVHDSKKWVVNTNTRVKTAQVYNYTGKEAKGLSIKIKGVKLG